MRRSHKLRREFQGVYAKGKISDEKCNGHCCWQSSIAEKIRKINDNKSCDLEWCIMKWKSKKWQWKNAFCVFRVLHWVILIIIVKMHCVGFVRLKLVASITCRYLALGVAWVHVGKYGDCVENSVKHVLHWSVDLTDNLFKTPCTFWMSAHYSSMCSRFRLLLYFLHARSHFTWHRIPDEIVWYEIEIKSLHLCINLWCDLWVSKTRPVFNGSYSVFNGHRKNPSPNFFAK